MGGSSTKEGYDVPGLGVDRTCRPRVVHRRCGGIHGWLERGWRSAPVAVGNLLDNNSVEAAVCSSEPVS